MIFVLGGTSDSLLISDWLTETKQPFILSVATDYGETLAKQHAENVFCGRLSKEEMCTKWHSENVQLVIDATHPFATIVSETAMVACKETEIPYIRFERTSEQTDNTYLVADIEEACKVATELGQRIFLTTGSKNLPEFVAGLRNLHIIARILPVSDVIRSAEELGLVADQIIGMKGPFTKEANRTQLEMTGADVLITKESGKQGGFQEKLTAAAELEIPVIVIRRKQLNYPIEINHLTELPEILTQLEVY
ncbi:precorrin-6A reductase [Listeria welshimeri]|uniref:precorrin-6A reductase n=1 Tax=Listeria welshimeri TaxID=1643 RepID=UPI001623F04E|nr:precorrin-6A reductase [Listeria welshimeri]MBC1360287.1 precorrin-6A reductase [Listeria welshimeri]MBC1971200.1 precorrin-6A reductase [Listeria welshimeri]MBC1991504.1 precorrin-6A reductase [Listeria welshimeri]MBC2026741.1 precorrin-6A reductase [Listeria welshimeri]MBF2472974.1 precorrin-6A reductase [Listeria welshimeri]